MQISNQNVLWTWGAHAENPSGTSSNRGSARSAPDVQLGSVRIQHLAVARVLRDIGRCSSLLRMAHWDPDAVSCAFVWTPLRISSYSICVIFRLAAGNPLPSGRFSYGSTSKPAFSPGGRHLVGWFLRVGRYIRRHFHLRCGARVTPPNDRGCKPFARPG